nr:hypothetical protein [Kibdelosporangium sp. MJ126-NF4]CTQ98932.1 hypothetical protein [Kibdelosporangium sp. MJ126-NF4]
MSRLCTRLDITKTKLIKRQCTAAQAFGYSDTASFSADHDITTRK